MLFQKTDLPKLLSSDSFQKSFSQLSEKNQTNLRSAMKLKAMEDAACFYRFVQCYQLEAGEYDELAFTLAKKSQAKRIGKKNCSCRTVPATLQLA